MNIEQLAEGARFRLAGIPERTGKVVRLGTGSAVVQYDGTTHREITVRRGAEVVDQAGFDVPLRPVTISLATQVIPITGRG